MKRYLTILLLAAAAAFTPGCTDIESDLVQNTALTVTVSELWFDSEGGSQMLEFRTIAGSWTLTQTQGTEDWCHPDRTSGTTSSAFYVRTEPNPDLSRESVLTISSPGCEPVQVKVIQNGLQDNAISFEPAVPDADQPLVITYKAVPETPLYDYEGDLYIHTGIVDGDFWQFTPADWYSNIDKCKMTHVGDNTWTLSMTPTVRDWFGSGETEVTQLGIIIRSADRTLRAFEDDYFLTVTDSRFEFVHQTPEQAPVPSGAEYGINYNSDGSVTFVLYEKDKNGAHYDYAYVIGEFSDWGPSHEYAMKRDEASGCWWYTMTGVESGREYMFQYYLVKDEPSSGFSKSVRISDPFSEIIYDGANDQYISAATYPDLPDYPKETTGLVSAFCYGDDEYQWQIPDYQIRDENNLIIYEMHFRDFSSTGDINGAMAHLDYIKDLGVNAVEVMPVQEFDGNDSWGYNPCSYLALDKAYGTRDMYKQFVDACHERGLAVIFDVVYNHMTGASPIAKLYWNAEGGDGGLTADNNPWFNVTAPHPYSVYHDLNHENAFVKEYVGRSLEYLIEEYKVDGFRFDLTKGFTNTPSDESSASREDQSRVNILDGYCRRVKAADPNAVVILEHFCDDGEQISLVNKGMKVWRNVNYAYGQSEMGYYEGSGFNALWTGDTPWMPFGGYVGYMESHDEERNAFRSKEYGYESIKDNLAARMARAALNSAFFFTVPGPKMIWQFEEIGYDISIEEGGRTAKKPLHWEYYDVPERKGLYDAYSELLKFRTENPGFFTSDASFSWNVLASNWPTGRDITCVAGDKAFVMIGNFDTVTRNLTAELPEVQGTWKNWLDPDEAVPAAGGYVTFKDVAPGEYKLLVNF